MPRKIALTEEQVAWLTRHHNRRTFEDQARRIGCCVDTLKRILVRLGLREFDGAKYAMRARQQVWIRPCMNCGCAKPRPRLQYICDTCTQEFSEYD